ncbi:MAG: AraC family transcriptional regulator [Clostridia bacterium]
MPKHFLLPRNKNFYYNPSKSIEELLVVSDQMGLTYSEDFHIKRSSFNNHLLLYVKSGIFHLEQYGKHYEVKAGQCLLTTLRDAHEYYSDKTDIVQALWFHFRGHSIEGIMTQLKNSNALPIFYQDNEIENQILDLFSIINERSEDFEYKFSPIIFSMVSAVTKDALMKMNNDDNYENWFHNSVILYIQNHITEKISLDDLSGFLGYKKSYFLKIYPKYFQISAHQLIIKSKLQYSVNLLLNSDMSVAKISSLLNFTDQSHYGKSFKKMYGMSPQNYRKL